MCTAVTSFGIFGYLWVAFGLKLALEAFQRFIHNLIGDLPKVICDFDKILVFGQTLEEHNGNLNRVLGKVKTSGLTLYLEKSKYCVISSRGISPDSDKKQSTRYMSSRQNKK